MRYLIIDQDYCVFKTDVISEKTIETLKAGKLTIIDVKAMTGIGLDGCSMEPVQNWSEAMIDAKIEI